MVSTGQGDEMSARDTGGQLAPGLEWSRDVASRMHDKRRRLHFRQKISDIEIAADIKISSSALQAEQLIAAYIAPDSDRPVIINELIVLFDGPEQREAKRLAPEALGAVLP